MGAETEGELVSRGVAVKHIDDETYVVTGEHHPGDSLSTTVVCAVAEVLDKDPVTLAPLTEFVNPDALDIFATSATDGFCSFTYADCRVSIDSNNRIQIQVDSPD